MIVVIDNYDSFVHNLARHMELAGWDCAVFRNNEITTEEIAAMNPEGIVLSPGPYTPKKAGICMELIERLGPAVPMLGICLGHQCIGEAYGGKTVRAQKPMHGKAGVIAHQGVEIFAGLPKIFKGGRYHSLITKLPEYSVLDVTARSDQGEIMAIQHRTHPVYGLQFHPESILTKQGMEIIRNFTAIARKWNQRRAQIAA
ncbi:MAG: aminodeoxychorismate/anthranilate synthase component II [Alphaproteobacteria bacterium]|nr:aminodeoxychorismate/anthranilate synthase component II [Alphaproteobacteria bacterium]